MMGYSTVTQFIQVYNTTSLPSNGVNPLIVIPITANAPWSIDFGVAGLPCTTGIVIGNSTTGPTKTIGAADTYISAVYH
jgi:hypothetical protein